MDFFIPYEIARYLESGTIIIVLILSFFAMQKWQSMDAEGILYENKTNFPILFFFCAFFCLVVGFRPPSGVLFGDSSNYARIFYTFRLNEESTEANDGEWLFNLITYFFSKNSSLNIYFTAIAFGYVFFGLLGIARLFRNNTYGATLFFFGAFSFFTYGTNGIRNGLATSLFILALSFIITPKKNLIFGLILIYLAYGIHRSISLPAVCLLGAYFLKDPKKAIFFWFFSILLFLTMRGAIEAFFSALGFDDRLSGYISGSEEYYELGFKRGFRPDFLLYSAMPIWLGWYVIKRIPNDKIFNLLLSTYVLANSFWVMVMNAEYSNRFAYLSWFLYPLVMAYPCLKMNIWEETQGKKAGYILLANVGFTAFMHFIYY